MGIVFLLFWRIFVRLVVLNDKKLIESEVKIIDLKVIMIFKLFKDWDIYVFYFLFV